MGIALGVAIVYNNSAFVVFEGGIINDIGR